MRDDYSWRIAVGVIFAILLIGLPFFQSDWVCDFERENKATCFRNWLSTLGQFLFPFVAVVLSIQVHNFSVRMRNTEILKNKRDDLNIEEEYGVKVSRTFMKLRGPKYKKLVQDRDSEIYSDIVAELRTHVAFIEARQIEISNGLLIRRNTAQKMLLILAKACQDASESIENGEQESEYLAKTRLITQVLRAAVDAYNLYRKELHAFRLGILHQMRGGILSNPKQ